MLTSVARYHASCSTTSALHAGHGTWRAGDGPATNSTSGTGAEQPPQSTETPIGSDRATRTFTDGGMDM